MSIINLLNQIKEQEIVLPAIQRNFVWDENHIVLLLDSIMRGYPVGIILLWETYEDIQYRHFVQSYTDDGRYKFFENSKHRKLKVVLDGQQRLQSLYIALNGLYEGKSLYFDVLSGEERDDSSQLKYTFRLGRADQAKQWNSKSKKERAGVSNGEVTSSSSAYFVKVADLFNMGAQDRQQFRRKLVSELALDDSTDLRIDTNLAVFNDALTKDENILKASVIDENRTPESEDRKTEADILEIFVRINRQGTALSRSDLIFSMLKLNWKESAEALPEFVERINKGNSFELDADFVIRCLFAVSELGTRFDLDSLRMRANIDKMKRNFQGCCDAIQSTLDFVHESCWCQSSRLLGGSATFIPFVYYFFHLPKRQAPNKEVDRIRKSMYLFGFTQPFSRYADSRLGSFIRSALKPLADSSDFTFPLDSAIAWVQYWEDVDRYGPALLQRNVTLALHVVQRLTGAKVQYRKNAPEIDHIFPKSVLKKKNFGPTKIERLANYWILAKAKNQNKSNKPPREYFKDVSLKDLRQARISRNLLDYQKYNMFLKKREQAILTAVSRQIGLTEKDFRRALTE